MGYGRLGGSLGPRLIAERKSEERTNGQTDGRTPLSDDRRRRDFDFVIYFVCITSTHSVVGCSDFWYNGSWHNDTQHNNTRIMTHGITQSSGDMTFGMMTQGIKTQEIVTHGITSTHSVVGCHDIWYSDS
jgi:hypothetical protein